MSDTSEAKIYERLNIMGKDLGAIKTDLAVVVEASKDCRPQVMGNGGDSMATKIQRIDGRIDLLEESRQGHGKWFLVGVTAALSLAVSVVSGTVVGAVISAMGN